MNWRISLIIGLLIVVGYFLVSQVHAQDVLDGEHHYTPFGTLTVFEVKRENQPNLVCYGIDNKLTGCELR